MKRGYRSQFDIRENARRLAHDAAIQREKDGDPEGAEIIRELAKDIKRIPLKQFIPTRPRFS